ncbi:MAG: hypothetical protein ACRDR6_13090 [Pseudonocardiaceae bacterium]
MRWHDGVNSTRGIEAEQLAEAFVSDEGLARAHAGVAGYCPDPDGHTVTAVSDEEAVPEPNRETLNIVRAELDIEREAQDQRSASADTRAGLIVGFSGVMASIAVNSKSLLTLPGLGLAVVAAVLATTVLWPRLQSTVSPRALRNRYLAGPPDVIKLSVLDKRILDYEENQEQIKIKIARLKRAIAVFVVAVAALLLGQATTLILGAFMN